MINLSKETWVERDVDEEKLKGVKAQFKLLKNKEYKVLLKGLEDGKILLGDEGCEEATKLLASSVKNIEGVEVKEDSPATMKDVLELAPPALVAAFINALVLTQNDPDFLTK